MKRVTLWAGPFDGREVSVPDELRRLDIKRMDPAGKEALARGEEVDDSMWHIHTYGPDPDGRWHYWGEDWHPF